ncbi:MAG: gamma-glutamylcyclotransferase [Pricia sp.]|nr:gamma-glutamylcyclotransferase [Pricia sp.]
MTKLATEYLFTYGTLQNEDVQMELFQRKLYGSKDKLVGYQLSEEKIAGRYPVVFRTGNRKDILEGVAYKLTPEELRVADWYEGELYARVQTTLASGKEDWVYIEA